MISSIVTVLLHPTLAPIKELRKSTQIVSGFYAALLACIGISIKISLRIICRENVRHQAKLVSIFTTNFLSLETNSSLALPTNFIARNKLVSSTSSILGTRLFRRKIGSIISVMFKIRIEKTGPPSLFLKPYFARKMFSWKFAFVSFSKVPKTFLAPALLQFCWGL